MMPDCDAGMPFPIRQLREQELLGDFVGQETLKQIVRLKISESLRFKSPLPHMLFWGPPQCGKAALAAKVAAALGTSYQHLNAGKSQTWRRSVK